MFEVSVSGQFKAGHRLRDPDGSPEPFHEHDWQVRVSYAGGALDARGLLLDFGTLRDLLDELLSGLDGRNLNDLPAFSDRPPSAENVAVFLAERLPAEVRGAVLRCVQVEEEPGCVARYWPAGQD